MEPTVSPSLADFLRAVSAAETPRQLDAAIQSLPLDWAGMRGPGALVAALQSLGDGLAVAAREAVRRVDLACGARIEDGHGIEPDELAAVAANGNLGELIEALARVPVDWSDFSAALHGMDETDLIEAGGLAVVLSNCPTPGHFVAVSTARVILKAADRLTELASRPTGLGDIAEALGIDPLTLAECQRSNYLPGDPAS